MSTDIYVIYHGNMYIMNYFIYNNIGGGIQFILFTYVVFINKYFVIYAFEVVNNLLLYSSLSFVLVARSAHGLLM